MNHFFKKRYVPFSSSLFFPPATSQFFILALIYSIFRSSGTPKAGGFLPASVFWRLLAGVIDCIFYNSNFNSLRTIGERLIAGEMKFTPNVATIALVIACIHLSLSFSSLKEEDLKNGNYSFFLFFFLSFIFILIYIYFYMLFL